MYTYIYREDIIINLFVALIIVPIHAYTVIYHIHINLAPIEYNGRAFRKIMNIRKRSNKFTWYK